MSKTNLLRQQHVFANGNVHSKKQFPSHKDGDIQHSCHSVVFFVVFSFIIFHLCHCTLWHSFLFRSASPFHACKKENRQKTAMLLIRLDRIIQQTSSLLDRFICLQFMFPNNPESMRCKHDYHIPRKKKKTDKKNAKAQNKNNKFIVLLLSKSD